jgi:hypothetical protein
LRLAEPAAATFHFEESYLPIRSGKHQIGAQMNGDVAGLNTTPPRLMLPIQGSDPMRVLILSLLAAALTC